MKPYNKVINTPYKVHFSFKTISKEETVFSAPDRFSIIFVESGYGKGSINTTTFSYKSPSILLLNEKDKLTLTKSSDFNGRIFSFSPRLIKDYFSFDNLQSFDPMFTADDINIAILLSIFYKPYDAYKCSISVTEASMQYLIETTTSFVHNCSISHYTCDLLIDILTCINTYRQHTLSIYNTIIQETNFEVDDILAYLHSHYHCKITIPKLSKLFNVNRTTLSDKFFYATGETIITYLNKYRINKASILLRKTDYSISEIAEMVGFNDTAYFSKLFKKTMFYSPSEYLKHFRTIQYK